MDVAGKNELIFTVLGHIQNVKYCILCKEFLSYFLIFQLKNYQYLLLNLICTINERTRCCVFRNTTASIVVF